MQEAEFSSYFCFSLVIPRHACGTHICSAFKALVEEVSAEETAAREASDAKAKAEADAEARRRAAAAEKERLDAEEAAKPKLEVFYFYTLPSQTRAHRNWSGQRYVCTYVPHYWRCFYTLPNSIKDRNWFGQRFACAVPTRLFYRSTAQYVCVGVFWWPFPRVDIAARMLCSRSVDDALASLPRSGYVVVAHGFR